MNNKNTDISHESVTPLRDNAFPAGSSSSHCIETTDLKDISQRNRRILLVDDEVLIGTLTAEMLVDMGFQVLTESDSVKALATFRESPDNFDLIITDQSMPVLTGCELVAEIRKVRSDIPVVFCTGFAHDIKSEAYRDLNIAAVCSKPFEFDLLRQVVDQALSPA